MAGFIIDCRIRFYVMRYVGNMHPKKPVPLFVLFKGYGIVKIFGVIRIDRNNQFVP